MSPVSDKAGHSPKSPLWDSALASADKMQRLDRLANLGMLSAGMAHEIKNGMVAIKTFVDLLLEKNQDAELADVVRHELQRINAIATQMLRIAAPNHATFKAVRVHEVLDHSLRLLQPQISVKLIALRKHYRAGSDVVQGDDAQLQQVFMNLLLNAVEATGPNGTLTITTETADGGGGAGVLQVQIQDTGVGIKPENVERLFEPFFTTKKNGTGLGLAISHRIMQEHRGDIRVQSEPGQSSLFTLSLPVGDA
jgi:signal transduction histidine kinase